jgi:hypothetical protein
MKKYIKFLSFLFLTVIMISCKKEDFNGLSDVRPTVPVTVTNAIDFRPEPTVSTSIAAGGAIQIVLAIPASSGRTIKEITRIAASTSYSLLQNTLSINTVGGFLNAFPTTLGIFSYASLPAVAGNLTLTGGYYNLTPIPVGATAYTYNTSLSQYFSIFPVAKNNLAAVANSELSFRLYFLITLNDGSVIIPEAVRVLVAS